MLSIPIMVHYADAAAYRAKELFDAAPLEYKDLGNIQSRDTDEKETDPGDAMVAKFNTLIQVNSMVPFYYI